MTNEQPPLPPEPEAVRYKNPVKIMGLGDLMSLAAPRWQIQDYIPNDSISTLYGAPGSGKSFLAQAFGLSVATGEPWCGKEVEQGGVLYLACEGISGIPKRILSWIEFNNLDIPVASYNDIPFYWSTGFNDLRGPGPTTDLIRAIEHDILDRSNGDRKLSLVILDTLSRSLGGADENSAGEMNTALDQLERVREATQASVMILHHTTKGKITERGSSVLRGACDTMLLLTDHGHHRMLSVDKQRDWEEADPLTLYTAKVGDSIVLTTKSSGPADPRVLNARERRTYAIIRESYNGQSMSYSQLVKLTEESETSLQRTLKILCDAGLLTRGEGKRGGYHVVPDKHETEETDDSQE